LSFVVVVASQVSAKPTPEKPKENLVLVYGSLLSGSHELFHSHECFLVGSSCDDEMPELVGDGGDE
jgi:hypothetical protein